MIETICVISLFCFEVSLTLPKIIYSYFNFSISYTVIHMVWLDTITCICYTFPLNLYNPPLSFP